MTPDMAAFTTRRIRSGQLAGDLPVRIENPHGELTVEGFRRIEQTGR